MQVKWKGYEKMAFLINISPYFGNDYMAIVTTEDE